jgi:hypothetical protein
LLSVTSESGTDTPIIGIERCTGRDRRIGFATYVGGGDLVCATRGDNSRAGLTGIETAILDAFLIVVVVVGADTAGVTSRVVMVVVVDVVGDGITTPEGGSETTPSDKVRVGPLGWLRGTKTIPKLPEMTKTRETAHHIICVGRFSFCDFTSPNLV